MLTDKKKRQKFHNLQGVPRVLWEISRLRHDKNRKLMLLGSCKSLDVSTALYVREQINDGAH
jgi:hypothetical protein